MIRFQDEVVDLGLIGIVHVHLPCPSLIYPWTASRQGAATVFVVFFTSSIFFAPKGTYAARHSIHTAPYVSSQP